MKSRASPTTAQTQMSKKNLGCKKENKWQKVARFLNAVLRVFYFGQPILLVRFYFLLLIKAAFAAACDLVPCFAQQIINLPMNFELNEPMNIIDWLTVCSATFPLQGTCDNHRIYANSIRIQQGVRSDKFGESTTLIRLNTHSSADKLNCM